MAKTFTAPFAQTLKTSTAVSTLACVIGAADAPTNTSLVCTAGADGALVTKVSSIPRATVAGTAMYLFISKDSGTTMRLIDSASMLSATVGTSAGVAPTLFLNISENSPLRLEAGDKLYIGAAVALAAGIVTKCESTDF